MALTFRQAPQKAVKASGGCQSPGNSLSPPGQRRSRTAPGCYRPIDIDRSPGMIGSGRFMSRRGGSPRANVPANAMPAPLPARTFVRTATGGFRPPAQARNRGLQPSGIEVLCIAAKKRLRRAVDVNPPVTVRTRAASTAAGAHQGRYRPIDIDRMPRMTGSRRFNGERVPNKTQLTFTAESAASAARCCSRVHSLRPSDAGHLYRAVLCEVLRRR
jgi:hypothetical protein